MPYNECHHPDHIRYGPRTPDPKEEQARNEARRAITALKKSKIYKQLVDMFNESRSASKRAKLLSDPFFSPPKLKSASITQHTQLADVSWVHTPYQISFPEIGKVHRDQKVGEGIYLNRGNDSPLYFFFHGQDMIINKLGEDKKYKKLAIFPTLSLTLVMDEREREDGSIHFTFSMQYDPSYGAKASLESAAL